MLPVTRLAALRLLPTPLTLRTSQAASRVAQISTTVALNDEDRDDLKVGPWPRTQEERIKAAKKYNLIPEDYEPFPEDEAMGDYPNLPILGARNRDPYVDWDDPVEPRNYGEPMHRYYEHSDQWLYDPMLEKKPGYFKAWQNLLGMAVILMIVPVISVVGSEGKLNINHPWKIRTYRADDPVYEFPEPKRSSSGH